MDYADYTYDQSWSQAARFNPYQGGQRGSRGASSFGPSNRGWRGSGRGKNRGRGRGEATSSSSSTVSSTPPNKVTYDKQQAKPTGMLMYQVPAWYPVFTSNAGIDQICEVVFDTIEGRDQRITGMVSLAQFKYVTCLCFIYRVARVNQLAGIPGPWLELSDLKEATTGICLPAIILRYIECIGVVALSSGVKIGPYFDNWLYLVNPQCRSPAEYLEEGHRPIPPNHWCIDTAWISSWNSHTERASRRSMGFAKPDYSLSDGKPELCVSVQAEDDDTATPFSPVQLSDQEGKLAACYQWRLLDRQNEWPGDYSWVLSPCMRGSEFNTLLYLNTLASGYIIQSEV